MNRQVELVGIFCCGMLILCCALLCFRRFAMYDVTWGNDGGVDTLIEDGDGCRQR